MKYSNTVLDKKGLNALLSRAADSFGTVSATTTSDRVKSIAFQSSTYGANSLSAQDLTPAPLTIYWLKFAKAAATSSNLAFYNGELTFEARHKKLTEGWMIALEPVARALTNYLNKCDYLSSLYLISFSGARGNLTQVKQLVGIRGLIMDAKGNLGAEPIRSNFFGGMTSLEVAISSYGARKGLLDTALRTADAGYLTRRLVDSTQDILIREEDCLGTDYLTFDELRSEKKTADWEILVMGRVLAKSLTVEVNNEEQINRVLPRNTLLTRKVLSCYNLWKVKEHLFIRSPLTCSTLQGVCRNCYGSDVGTKKLVNLGKTVGVLAGQSIGEPGTQMVLRTFHTGGGGISLVYEVQGLQCPLTGLVKYHSVHGNLVVHSPHEELYGLVLATRGSFFIVHRYCTVQLTLPAGAILFLRNNSTVQRGQVMADLCFASTRKTNLYENNLFSTNIDDSSASDVTLQKSGYKTIWHHLMCSGEALFCNSPRSSTSLQSLSETPIMDSTLTHKSRHVGQTQSLWVLNGDKYQLSRFARSIKPGKNFTAGTIIGDLKIINKTAGLIRFSTSNNHVLGSLITQLSYLQNALMVTKKHREYLLLGNSYGKEVSLKMIAQRNQILEPGDILALSTKDSLDSYRAPKCGVIYYDDTKSKLLFLPENRYYMTSSELRKVSESLIKSKTPRSPEKSIKYFKYLAKPGTKITSSITAEKESIVEINLHKRTLILKQCKLYCLKEKILRRQPAVKKPEGQFNLFTSRACMNTEIEDYTYIEELKYKGNLYLAERPLLKYSLKGNNVLEYTSLMGVKKRTKNLQFFSDFQKIHVSGEYILQNTAMLGMSIKIDIPQRYRPHPHTDSSDKNDSNRIQTMEYEALSARDIATLTAAVTSKKSDTEKTLASTPVIKDISGSSRYKICLVTKETIKLPKFNYGSIQYGDQLILKSLLPNETYVIPGTTLASLSLVAGSRGRVLKKTLTAQLNLVVLRPHNISCFLWDPKKEIINVKEGDCVRIGTLLTTRSKSNCVGQIYRIDKTRIFIRKGSVLRLPTNSNINPHLRENKYVEKGTAMARLTIPLYKAKDITQGIRDISRILEVKKGTSEALLAPTMGLVIDARPGMVKILTPTKRAFTYKEESDTSTFSFDISVPRGQFVHVLDRLSLGKTTPRYCLYTLFYFHISEGGFDSRAACEESLRPLRLSLISEVRETYLEYGIQIAEKHIEIIIRRMTSKVVVTHVGDTHLMEGEYIEQQKISILEQASVLQNLQKPKYEPTILGLTKTSLNSDSFLSAASFQATIKVLTSAAIRGRKDWLLGLKEAIITGRIMPQFRLRSQSHGPNKFTDFTTFIHSETKRTLLDNRKSQQITSS